MSAEVGRARDVGVPIATLGPRIRLARIAKGFSPRELAGQLGVSPSFVSQLENGKSQPSVATLYSLSRILEISIDGLFAETVSPPESDSERVERREGIPAIICIEAAAPLIDDVPGDVNRGDLGPFADSWFTGNARGRFSIISKENRSRLVMDSGVVWEQLARVGDPTIDFMEIIYPPGSSSTNDGRMLQHAGFEFGYLLQGELQVTYGFETIVISAGQSIGLNSWMPHLFTNLGEVVARGVWCVHHTDSSRDAGNA